MESRCACMHVQLECIDLTSSTQAIARDADAVDELDISKARGVGSGTKEHEREYDREAI